jgi:hypothetical protein
MRSIFLSFLAISWAATLPSQVVTDKLEAYFSFNSVDCKGVDDSGNGSSAALKGGVGCTCAIGGSGVLFADTLHSISMVGPFADVFSTSDFTVSFYMRPTPPANALQNASQLIMAKQGGCTTTNAFWVRYNYKNNRISVGLSEDASLFTTVTAELDPDACWQYVTITRSNTRVTIYVNGIQKAFSNSVARINLSNTSPLVIGQKICPTDVNYRGIIDEIRFHSKALNDVEIARYNVRADKILNRDTIIYLGNSFQASVSEFCAGQFEWSPLMGVSNPTVARPTITPTETTRYTLTFTYADGCIAEDDILVTVIDPSTLDCNKIFVPNAFTPGGTPGLNDVFGISNPFAVSDFISFEIFDRWGGRVFTAATPFETWDGTSNGQALNPGVFLYRLYYKCNGEEKVKAGNLTLLR